MRRKDRNIPDIILIEDIILKADVCRIALANGNIPYMVTMNFGYTGNPQRILYFHCANQGRKLDMIRKNSYTCFEMDIEHQLYSGIKGCDWGMKFSSVVGYGNTSIIEQKEERITGLNCIMRHYAGDKEFTYSDPVFERTTVLRLDIIEMTVKKC